MIQRTNKLVTMAILPACAILIGAGFALTAHDRAESESGCPGHAQAAAGAVAEQVSQQPASKEDAMEQPTQDQADHRQPSPDLSAGDAVRLQVEALRDNDDPYKDAGIEEVYNFASPANRAHTGPLPRFKKMVHNPLYESMLGWQEAEYGKMFVDGDTARQEVVLTSKGGERVGYRFELSKQSGGEYEDCWMTDAVMRFDPEG